MQQYLVCFVLVLFSTISVNEACMGCKVKSVKVTVCSKDTNNFLFHNITGGSISPTCVVSMKGTAALKKQLLSFSLKLEGTMAGSKPVNYSEADGCAALIKLKKNVLLGPILEHYGLENFRNCPVGNPKKPVFVGIDGKTVMMQHRPVVASLQGATDIKVTFSNINGSKQFGCLKIFIDLKCGRS